MLDISESSPHVLRLVIAGLLLAALEYLRRFDLPRPSAQQILDALGVGRSQAYEYRNTILDRISEIPRRPGRPSAPPTTAVDTSSLTLATLRFVIAHPGSTSGDGARRHYSESFRRFALELRECHSDIELVSFAQAIQVPHGTVEDWLRTKPSSHPRPKAELSDELSSLPEIETVVASYRTWEGTFLGFVEHLRENLRIDHGIAWVRSILTGLAGRQPYRRPGRKPDADAIRKSFQTFFPGAQWVGDGTQIAVKLNGTKYVFNVELMIDAFSSACVGASVRDEEDARAVTDAFSDGVAETGAAPIAVLLDNRPSNHTDEVKAAAGGTLVMNATPYRPENKAHVEGTFGLLKQVAPPLEIEGSDQEIAREILKCLVQIWARTLNHRPMKGRKGATRAQLLAVEATPEQVAEAKRTLAERQRQNELAEQRRRAREDPITRSLLDEALVRLDLADTDDRLRRAISSYPKDSVLAAIATFQGKKTSGTLPPGVDARYLLGIARNVTQKREGIAIADQLLRLRLEARDRSLATLTERLDVLKANALEPNATTAIIDELTSTKLIDKLFWTDALAKLITTHPSNEHSSLLQQTARRIHAAFAVPSRERVAVVQRLTEKVIPLDG